jgi:ATP-dependent DNA helicase DinG
LNFMITEAVGPAGPATLIHVDGQGAGCDLLELASILVPGFDPGAQPPDPQGLAADLQTRLEQLDLGLIDLVAMQLRGANPAVSHFLAAAVEEKRAEGLLPGAVTDWIEPHERPEQRTVGASATALEEDEVAAVLGPDGPLARAMAGYEPRPQQVDVLRRMTRALNESHHLLMEAPTGTGKSLAYLIPAAMWAAQNQERVLIATHTIALQEQLLAKDLPLLERILNRPVRAAVVKGRSHYVCLRKWEEEVQAIGFQTTDQQAEFLARISSWLGQTSTGDRAEVLRGRSDAAQWEAIASETATCIGPACKWFAKHCFAHRVRREAQQADVLVTNHALLCAQLRQGNQGFPAFRRVIVDEAHQLEAVATAAFTSACSLDALQVSLNQLNNNPAPGALGDGQLRTLARTIGRPFTPAINGLTFPPDRDLFDLLGDVVVDGRQCLLDVRARLQAMAPSGAAGDGRAVRLGPAVWERRPDLRQALHRLGSRISVLVLGLREVMQELSDRGAEGTAANVRGRLPVLEEALETLRGLLAPGGDQVGWAEVDREAVLKVAPLYPGERLKERLFDAYPTVALVSATLSVSGSFEHAARGLGLTLAQTETAVVESPFAWKEQAQLLVLDDAPAPRGAADPVYVQRLTEVLGQLVPEVGGQCLVLFTSNAVLKAALDALQPALGARGVTLLGQGIDGTPSQLVERLKAEANVVVFGSGSFWEGVDLPGEALSCLIITRLPFRPPDSPVAAARAEREERLGRNPFDTLSLPEAVIRFRQGFGRLIRTRTDRGVVIVLDGRILPANSRYADVFLASLPPVTRFRGSMATVLRRTKEWLGRTT